MKRIATYLTMVLLAAGVRAQTVPVVVQSTSSCATSVDGSVVGLLNPLTVPTLAPVYSGALPAATYYVEIAWLDAAGHTTLASPETSAQLSAPGSMQVAPPPGMPALAVGMGVYIGTASGAETLQGTTSGSAVYTQAAALASGAVLPATNTTLCEQTANDAGWPTGTGYNVSLIDRNGNALPGYPMQWQLLGPGQTYNLNTGLPLYNGVATYGSTIQAIPYNHGLQSISGPLSLAGYPLLQVLALGVGTNVPGWPIDNELGATNSLGGYIVNGGLGVGTGYTLCAGSDAYHTFMPSATPCSESSTINYQTIMLAGTALPVEPAINFTQSPLFIVTDHPTSPKATNIKLNGTGTEGEVVTSNGAGVHGHCMNWDAYGGAGDSGSPCLTATATIDYYWTIPAACTIGTGQPNQCLAAAYLPGAMPDTSYQVFCFANALSSPSSLSVSIGTTPLPTAPSGLLELHVTQIMQNDGGGVTPDVYCHAHHN